MRNLTDITKLDRKLMPVTGYMQSNKNNKYQFSYCLIDTDKEYLVENHLICISSFEKLERNLLLEKYNLIINSLKSEKTIYRIILWK
jgi:hypothetical protein